jgi:hypothetical protein
MRRDGVTLWMAGLNPGVLTMVRKSKLGRMLGADGLFANVEAAVEAYLKRPRGSA